MKEYPPQLDEALENCHKAASFYVKAWRDRDPGNLETIYYREQLVDTLSVHYKTIKHDLMLLKRAGLIEFSISEKKKITIKFNISEYSQKAA